MKRVFSAIIAILAFAGVACAQSYQMTVITSSGKVVTVDADDLLSVTFAKTTTVKAATGTDLADALKNVDPTAEIVRLELAAGGEYTCSAPVECAGDLVVTGDAAKPAKIKMGNNKFLVVDKGLTLQNVEIDASECTTQLICWNSTPSVEAVESGQFVILTPVIINNVKATGMTSSFMYDGGKAYAWDAMTINNCVLEWESQDKNGFNFASSMPIVWNVTNNTMYSKAKTGQIFIGCSGKRPWQITGYEERKGEINFENNTFFQLANTKQFFNTNTLKGQKNELFTFKKNIFVDCSNKKIYANITNNNAQLTCEDNTYWFDGVAYEEPANYNADAGLTTDPAFKDAANGDFTPTGAEQVAKKAGDPRWF